MAASTTTAKEMNAEIPEELPVLEPTSEDPPAPEDDEVEEKILCLDEGIEDMGFVEEQTVGVIEGKNNAEERSVC